MEQDFFLPAEVVELSAILARSSKAQEVHDQLGPALVLRLQDPAIPEDLIPEGIRNVMQHVLDADPHGVLEEQWLRDRLAWVRDTGASLASSIPPEPYKPILPESDDFTRSDPQSSQGEAAILEPPTRPMTAKARLRQKLARNKQQQQQQQQQEALRS